MAAGRPHAPARAGGSRSLQDLFTDRKVPRERRAHAARRASPDGEIAWVPGVGHRRALRVTDATRGASRLALAPRLRARMRDAAIGEILVQADDLQHRVRELGEEITRDYAGQDLLLSACSRAPSSSSRT